MGADWRRRFVRLGSLHEFRVEEVLAGWREHVARIAREAGSGASDESWSPHDLIAALIMRDALAESAESLDDADRRELMSEVESIDRLYRNMTREDPECKLMSYGGEKGREGWWWKRIPIQGPILEEIDQ